MTDPADFLLRELELGDERIEGFREELLACVAAAIEDALAQAASIIADGGDPDSLEVGELPDMDACLAGIASRSFDAGRARGAELAEEIEPASETFAEPEEIAREILDSVDGIASSWSVAIREAISEKYRGLVRDVLEIESVPRAAVAKELRGVKITLGSASAAPAREAAAAGTTVPIPEPIPSPKSLGAATADGKDAVKVWTREEAARRAAAIETTVAQQAAVGIDVEANELGKFDVATADPRVRALRVHIVSDLETTCLCGGLIDATIAVSDPRARTLLFPKHINCRSSVSYEDIPEDAVNFDTPRTVTVNERPKGGGKRRTTYNVAPADLKIARFSGRTPPPRVLTEIL